MSEEVIRFNNGNIWVAKGVLDGFDHGIHQSNHYIGGRFFIKINKFNNQHGAKVIFKY